MNPRDLALVGAVLVLAGFAVADAVRSDRSAPPPSATGTTNRAADTQNRAAEQRREIFPAVRARGSLVFTEVDDCRLRDVSVPTGVEFPLPRIETSCELWTSPVGNRIAYGRGRASGRETRPFRFLDLGRALRGLGVFEGSSDVVWSLDGQRAAWCDGATSGFDYEVGRQLRRVAFCPRAYTPEGRLAHVRERELLVDGRAVVTAPGHIDHVSWGRDGSLGLVLFDGRIERRVGARLTDAVTLPTPFRGRPLVLSPDNCAALVIQRTEIHVVDVGCFRGRGSITNVSPDNCLNRRQVNIALCARFPTPKRFVGTTGVWSPDGEWIAVAELDAIAFHRVVGRYDAVRWDANASHLAWR